MAYKVFTNGSVLNASEINENLMNQSVMVFSNSTARAAALTSPLEGMVTYLEDTAVYESYDGASWIAFGGSEPGVVHLNTTAFTAQSSIMINNVFTTDYDFYQINSQLIGSTAADLRIRLASSGTAATGSNYSRQRMLVYSTNIYEASQGTDTSYLLAAYGTSNNFMYKLDLANPAQATQTAFMSWGGRLDMIQFQVGSHTLATAYDGLNLFTNSGTMTGSVSIYGLRK